MASEGGILILPPHAEKSFVNSYSGRNLVPFSRLENLESFAVLNAPAESLDGIASLRRLRFLRLANLRKLRSLAGIETLTRLEEIEIHTCRRITSINEVGLTRIFESCISTTTMKLLRSNRLLRYRGWSRCCSMNAQMSWMTTCLPLMWQKHLSRVSFQNRRHYSHKREEFGVAYSK